MEVSQQLSITRKIEVKDVERLRPLIVFVIDTLQTGGAEISLLENVCRFKKMRVVVIHLYQGNQLTSKFKSAGVPVRSLEVQAKYGFNVAYKRLLKVLLELQPSVIVAYLTRSEIVSRLVGKKLKIPVVGTLVSDLYSPGHNITLSWKGKLGIRLFRLINRVTSRWCVGFVANSEYVKRTGHDSLGIATERIGVIYRGRDSRLFFPRDQETEIGLKRFLNVGRLVPVKNQLFLINVFADLVRKHPDSILHIAGDGPMRQVLQNEIRRLGMQDNIVLLGRVDDIASLMRKYGCLISTSSSEGFSGTLVEAAFSQLPIIACDIPANREIVVNDRSGRLYTIDSKDSLLNELQWLIDHRKDAELMAQNARQYALSKFEQDKQAMEFEHYLLQFVHSA